MTSFYLFSAASGKDRLKVLSYKKVSRAGEGESDEIVESGNGPVVWNTGTERFRLSAPGSEASDYV